MAVGFPVKDDYATGDVLTAANMNDFAGTLNTVITPLGNAAGKNKIINGNFGVNQRAFTSTTGTATFTFDRWATNVTGGTVTYSAQTFTPGAAPASPYESSNFLRCVVSGQSATTDVAEITNRIEDVRNFAGQTVTVSFWAKADAVKNVAFRLTQNFGSGGSASVQAVSSLIAITTSWARYSATLTLTSLSGKTIGANNFLLFGLYSSQGSAVTPATGLGLQSGTFDVWGFQVEEGSIATPFQTATGTIQGELAACQRYYIRYGVNTDNNFDLIGPIGSAGSTTAIYIPYLNPTFRTAASAVDFANLRLADNGGGNPAVSTITIISNSNPMTTVIEVATTGATQFRPYQLQANNSTDAYIGFSAEL
jgi:hypothetical protein